MKDCWKATLEITSWRNAADGILTTEARDVCINDISLFVEQKAHTSSNPVFGKLPFLDEEKKNSKDKHSNLKPENPGGKLLNFVTISEKKPSPSSSNNVLSLADSPKRNCPFFNTNHDLTECSSFAKVADTEHHDFWWSRGYAFLAWEKTISLKDVTRRNPVSTVIESMPLWYMCLHQK